MIYTRKKKRPPDSGLTRLAIDFDGVLMKKSRAKSFAICNGAAMPGALDALKKLNARWELVVFSSRASNPDGYKAIWDWLALHNFATYISFVTPNKINAVAYIDDRARRFQSWDKILEEFEK